MDLTPGQIGKFKLLLPFLENGQWITCRILKTIMYASREYTKKQVSKIDIYLSELYNQTELLERTSRRTIYFKGAPRNNNVSTYAYRINQSLIKGQQLLIPFPSLKGIR